MAFLKLFHLFFLFLWLGSMVVSTRLLSMKAYERPWKTLRSLYLTLDLPAMCASLLLGLTYLFVKGVTFKEGWLHMKLTFAALLILCDLLLERGLAKKRGHTYFLILHNAILLLLLFVLFAIIILKP